MAGRWQETLWQLRTEEEMSDVEEEATGTTAPPKQGQQQHQQAHKEKRADQRCAPAAVLEAAEQDDDTGKPRKGRGGRRSTVGKDGKAAARKVPARGHGRKRPSSSKKVRPIQVLKLSDREESLGPSDDDE